jgi:alpha-L-rhamnosidase
MRFSFLVFALFAFSFNLFAQTDFDRIKTDWQTPWLCPPSPDDTLKNTWLCWRNTLTINGKIPPSVSAMIAVDSKYWLYINGQIVVREGQLKRGATPTDSYFDSLNIAPYLKKGKNTIAILQWYFGKDGFSHKNSGRAGFRFELVGQLASSSKLDASLNNWKVQKYPAYLRHSPPPQPNYRLAESNIHFDANLDINNWLSETYDDSKWSTPVIVPQSEGDKIWGKTWLRPIPFWRDSDLKTYPSVSKRIGANQDTLVATLPRNLLIYPYLKIKAVGNERIEIRTDNYKGGSEYNVRADYICRAGEQEFEVLGFQNGHEVWYIVPKTVEIIDLKYRQTQFNTEGVGFFECSDPFLNKLWEKSRNTLDISLRDNYMDCPDRERAQWWGDAVIQMEETFYAYDRRVDALSRKAIRDLTQWQRPDSVLYAPAPAGNWNTELPGQMLASIWGIQSFCLKTGNTDLFHQSFNPITKYLNLWQKDAKNLVIKRENGWVWHDWGHKVDMWGLDNIWYYTTLSLFEDCLHFYPPFYKNTEGGKYVGMQGSVLKNAINQHLWNGKAYVSPNFPHAPDDRVNGLAVMAGLADSAKWQSIKALLDTTYNAGPYMEKYILEAYFKMGDAKLGIERMKKRYKMMVESPLSTLWEGWAIGSATYGGGTYNHGWTGGPLTLMSRYIGGLDFTKIGYTIQPQLADLQGFKVGAATFNGFVSAEWKSQKKKVIFTVNAPLSKGRISIPTAFAHSKIKMNGKVVWKKGKNLKNTERGKLKEGSKDYINFEVEKGVYQFEIE